MGETTSYSFCSVLSSGLTWVKERMLGSGSFGAVHRRVKWSMCRIEMPAWKCLRGTCTSPKNSSQCVGPLSDGVYKESNDFLVEIFLWRPTQSTKKAVVNVVSIIIIETVGHVYDLRGTCGLGG